MRHIDLSLRHSDFVPQIKILPRNLVELQNKRAIAMPSNRLAFGCDNKQIRSKLIAYPVLPTHPLIEQTARSSAFCDKPE